jgi:malate dehydrogenase
MVPLPRHCSVNGVPLLELMDRATVDAIVERVQGAGGEVVGLLKTGSAFVSPAAASVEMAESVILDQKRVLPCAAYLEGEYGASGIYMGVPVVLGAGGAERILELELDAGEKQAMQKTIAHVEKLIGELEL